MLFFFETHFSLLLRSLGLLLGELFDFISEIISVNLEVMENNGATRVGLRKNREKDMLSADNVETLLGSKIAGDAKSEDGSLGERHHRHRGAVDIVRGLAEDILGAI